MIEFGMPTLMEITQVEETVALCAELGLSFVELNTNFPMHQPHLLDADRLNQLAEQYGISYTIHLNDEMAVAESTLAFLRAIVRWCWRSSNLRRKLVSKS